MKEKKRKKKEKAIQNAKERWNKTTHNRPTHVVSQPKEHFYANSSAHTQLPNVHRVHHISQNAHTWICIILYNVPLKKKKN